MPLIVSQLRQSDFSLFTKRNVILFPIIYSLFPNAGLLWLRSLLPSERSLSVCCLIVMHYELRIMNNALYIMHYSEMKAFQTFFKHFLKKSLKNEGTGLHGNT